MPKSSTSQRLTLIFVPAMTALVAASADLVGGQNPWHATALGMLTATIAALRVGSRGAGKALLAVSSAAVLSQPVFHAVTLLVSPSVEGLTHHLEEDAFVSLLQIVLAGAAVLALSTVETIVAAAGYALREWRHSLRLLLRDRPESTMAATSRGGASPMLILPPRCGSWWRHAARRGPPADSSL